MNDIPEMIGSEQLIEPVPTLPVPAEPVHVSEEAMNFAGLSLPGRLIGLILAAALAFFTVLVEHVRRSGAFAFNTPAERAATALQVVLYIVFFILGWKLIDWFDKKAVKADPGESGPAKEASPEEAAPNPAAQNSAVSNSAVNVPAARRRHLFASWNARSVILTAILLFVLFLPYLIVFYPGVASRDTYNQIRDFVTGTMPIEINWNAGEPMISCFLNDHHPVLDTLIFTFFTEFTGGLAGSAARGAFIYSCLQAALTALAMSLMLCRMEKLGIPYLYRKAGILFLGLSPFVALYAIGMTKDSIYSLLFIFYYILYVTIIRDEATNGRMLWLILLSVLLAATKKTGVYFVLLCNLVLIFVPGVRRKWAEWAASWVLPAVLMMVLLPKVLFPMFAIFPGGKQESIGFTMQMTAKTWLDHKEELSFQERKVISDVMDLNKVEESYSSYNYDEVKKLFNYSATDQQLSAYKRLWLQLFIRYPLSGINALFGTAGGFFTPTESIRVYYEFPSGEDVRIQNSPRFTHLREAVQTVYQWLCKAPGADFFMQCVLYMWWLPLAVLIRALLLPDFKGKRIKTIGCLIPIAVSVLVLWVSPYAMARYGLPQLYTLPLVMGLGSRK